ncbi:beta-ketoacyl-[acyl-carrier-protein] synthase family protein [Streptomyces sp. HNM0575]|uniref:beta-ketoacyl-[acyl-carrier-protein] synthase family protein n=1 Tax=Streptomyces sp. HNM0575 TaxID=2716338 RepID=UPI00145EBFDF|nr:beta-ketoacyl-[acyl-carrier-protein] synthase family protein [Streptomyces sp. HNM0575]NLU76581.1 beta-ketoacyl-[acyl-carrier-protein] synthase family protein [Streptomyces sp. HNM0575]
MAEEPVAITGMGVVLPGADDAASFWDHLRAGRSQVSALDRFDSDAEQLRVFAGGQLRDFDHRGFLPGLPDRHAAKYSTEILAGLAAVSAAHQDSGIPQAGGLDPRRLSVVQSTSRGGLSWWVGGDNPPGPGADLDNGAMFRGLAGSPASLAAIHIGAKGLVTTVSSACVGGHHAIGLALRELRSGASDAVLVGGTEFPLVPAVLRTFQALGPGVLSPERDVPEQAVRPYSAHRNGMALGEGAICLMLERASDATARGADVYAHVYSAAAMNEAGHATSMDLTGKVTAELISDAVEDAGRSLNDVGYFCGHGTATHYNDLAESRALRALYPHRPVASLPPIGSNKPVFGHTLGMAGIVNVAATALMLRHQELAPTINVGEVAPECDHDHVAEGARTAGFDLAVSLAFAIGSQTSAVVLGRA